jgi:hypothetical protein
MRIAHNVQLAAILAVGAFALHQLRYLIAFGGSASAEMAQHHGHGYMTDLLPALAVLVLAGALTTLIRGTEGASPSRGSLVGRTAFFACALFIVYACQESFEGILSAGQPAGIADVANGSWIALPLSLVIGALAALLARALERVEHVIGLTHADRSRVRPPAVRGRAFPARTPRLAAAPLAFGLARRPPPLASG